MTEEYKINRQRIKQVLSDRVQLAIASITIIEIVNLLTLGLDGFLLGLVIATISGLAGYSIKDLLTQRSYNGLKDAIKQALIELEDETYAQETNK